MIAWPGALVLALVFAAAALQSAVALRPSRAGRAASFFVTREADATHLVMNGVMAFMVTPAYAQRFQTAMIVLLGATALSLIVLVTFQGRRSANPASPDGLSPAAKAFGTGYHVAMLVAMIYATRLMGGPADPASGAAGAMAGMGSMAITPHAGLSMARVLAAVFVLDAVGGAAAVLFLPATLIRSEAARQTPPDATEGLWLNPTLIRTLQIGFLPHLVMDLGMALMLAPF